MEFKYNLQDTLEARFTDMDECHDVATHGANTGVPGLTYTWEINEFFNEFENEIENYYYDMFGDTWIAEMSHGITSLDELKARLVWGYVEMWCCDKLEEAMAA